MKDKAIDILSKLCIPQRARIGTNAALFQLSCSFGLKVDNYDEDLKVKFNNAIEDIKKAAKEKGYCDSCAPKFLHVMRGDWARTVIYEDDLFLLTNVAYDESSYMYFVTIIASFSSRKDHETLIEEIRKLKEENEGMKLALGYKK